MMIVSWKVFEREWVADSSDQNGGYFLNTKKFEIERGCVLSYLNHDGVVVAVIRHGDAIVTIDISDLTVMTD